MQIKGSKYAIFGTHHNASLLMPFAVADSRIPGTYTGGLW
jgi:hypothetical protein